MCGHFAYRSKQRGPYRGCGEEAYRRWMEYNRKKTICGENRNSYSKTDTDATFMHMKDDHMRNGQLKPGYNVQFAVNSGFITGIGVFSNRTDFGTLIPFLTYLWHKHGKSYRNVVADSGYESLANYRWLFENGQTAFIKPANYESGKSVLQSHRLAEWKTWAITNRMTALSARTADIWISVLTIPPMRRTVQSANLCLPLRGLLRLPLPCSLLQG